MFHDSEAAYRSENERARGVAEVREKQGVRTHVLLVIAMALVIASATSLCVLLIRNHLLAEVTDDLSQDLDHSVITFQNLQAERLGALGTC